MKKVKINIFESRDDNGFYDIITIVEGTPTAILHDDNTVEYTTMFGRTVRYPIDTRIYQQK